MISRAARRWSPWSTRDLVPWAVLAVLGHALVFGGWWYASREAAFQDQFEPAALTVAGLALAVFAHVSWLLRAHRRVVVRRTALWPDAVTAPVAAEAPEAATTVVLSATSDRYHRPDCQLVAGKGWRVMPRDDVAGRPCEVCGP